MATNKRPIEFRDYLPEVFRADEVNGASFLSKFLKAFETQFERLEGEIEGTPGGVLQLTVQSVSGTVVRVAPFKSGPVEFAIGSPVTFSNQRLRSTLKLAIPANRSGLTQIEVQDAAFASALTANQPLAVHPGGLPDLFNFATTPPLQLAHRAQTDFEFLEFLASWIGLPLRTDLVRRTGETGKQYEARRVQFNRELFRLAVALQPQRSTLPGLEAMLRAWLQDELAEPPALLLTNLTRMHNELDTIFQLAPENAIDKKPGEIYAQVGVTTVLGEGPPFFFMVDLAANPSLPAGGRETVEQAVRFLLDAEKPAHTYYELHVR